MDIYHWDAETDIHYSPDDGGYYAACYRTVGNRGTSQLFDTFQDALRALSDGTVQWSDNGS